jgi:osmotically-inducible protein OsmY
LVITLVLAGCAGTETKKSTGEVIDDAAITTKVKAALVDDPAVKSMQIKVKTFRAIVQLSGFVDSQQAKERAQKIAEGVDGVKEVKNDIVVKSEISKTTH